MSWEEGLTPGKATGQYKETNVIDTHTHTDTVKQPRWLPHIHTPGQRDPVTSHMAPATYLTYVSKQKVPTPELPPKVTDQAAF